MVSVPGEAFDHTGHFFYFISCSKMKAKNVSLLSFCVFNFFLVCQIVSK